MGYLETVARVMHGNFDDATDAEKLAAVRDVTVVCSVGAAAIAVQPVPLLDVALLAPVHIGMVQAIGQVHGHKLDAKSVVEMLATFGGSIVTREKLRQLGEAYAAGLLSEEEYRAKKEELLKAL
jgi:hypothetical protein